jgi:hypothetical protein
LTIRSWIKSAVALSVSLVAIPTIARAQSAAQLLAKAESLYNASSIEAARLEFLKVVNSRGQVKVSERVDAYKFLGASYAVLNQRDSAVAYFVSALDNDPFTTLETTFGGDEQAAFAVAKKTIFKAGITDILEQALDPRSVKPESSTYTFHVVTTHTAKLTVELAMRGDSSKHETLFSGNNDGTKDLPWHGVILAQRADSGIYELRVIATDQLASPAVAAQTVEKPTVLFRLSQVYEPLEDTLPSLLATDTLVTQNGRMAPIWDFVKGASVASIALGVPAFLHKSDLPGWTTHAFVGVGLGLSGGTIAAIIGSKNPNNPVAVAENARRRRQHDTFNAGVRARNASRLARTILVVRPLTGAGGG